ncbi:CdaR family protein [Natronincola ferrireducens]|uniref:YbbR domain-containing protein n=1 Tax=Natronincola ferrireducens TaxID=393762 RepID=A0A1G9J1X4_9FIRM|nr:CdaR family protein [Natronincola ferrireducens]SDL31480.1 YbbR domain-containing protein [Natronincola ferrireducens]
MSNFNRRNLMPKMISILFALTIWMYVMSEINPRITTNEQNIPIVFENIEEVRQMGLVVKGNEDYTIRVRLSGRRDAVQRVSRDEIKATADLLGYRAGVNNIPIEVSVPNDVEVDFSPKFIRVELEEIVSKQKPINIVVEGTPRKGHVLGKITYEPTVVWVEGPESLVNAVEVVEATIKLAEEFQNITTEIPLRPLNSRGEEVQNVWLETNRVVVTLPIDQLKTVEVNPLVEVTGATGYEVSSIAVNPSTVTIRGQQEILDTIEYIETEAIVINNVSENITRSVGLKLPEGVTVVEPETVDIVIAVEAIVEEIFEITRDDVVFNNVASGLRVDRSEMPEVLQVKILANETVLQAVDIKDIKIIVDMGGLDENQYTIEPVVDLPFLVQRRARQIELIPKTINVRLIRE